MTRYRLAHHVRACATEEGVVLMDLRNGRYLGLDGAGMEILGCAIDGLPPYTKPSFDPSPVEHAAVASIIELLKKEGLLHHGGPRGRRELSRSARTDPPRATLVDRGATGPAISLRHVTAFVLACARAALQLRIHSIEQIVRQVERRKARHGTARSAFDLERLRGLMSTYRRLRPFLFSVKGRCLFDSLALIHFFAAFRLFPAWVIGIKTAPFKAHSWVQERGFVFNGTPDYVEKFTPILVI